MLLRESQLERLDGGVFDVFVIGGGVNGAVASAALASSGVRVAMVDRGDFAGFTSSASSNLVWGGFKYLENYEFGLVRDLSVARNRMMKAYPANVEPIGFLAALGNTSPFPPKLAALGTVAYWAIGSFATRRPELLSPEEIKEREPRVDVSDVSGGVRYDDAYLRENDARFVFNFVRLALDYGAIASNYVSVDNVERVARRWHIDLSDSVTGATYHAEADVIINAAGPFVDGLNDDLGFATKHKIAYSKGIHLVVPQIVSPDRVLAFFDDTERLFYVIPMDHRSVIGTTDTRVDEAFTEVTDEDRLFVLEQINARLDLETPLTLDDIISERCGVRPLVVETDFGDTDGIDWTSLSRKHEIEVDDDLGVISVFGGKLTDCLNVGEEITEMVRDLGIEVTEAKEDWFGEPSEQRRNDFLERAADVGLNKPGQLTGDETIAERLWRRYGNRSHEVISAIARDPSLAEPVLECSDHLRAELELISETEMVVSLDDFLRRRSKVAMLNRAGDVRADPGLAALAEGLFGTDGAARVAEYLAAGDASAVD